MSRDLFFQASDLISYRNSSRRSFLFFFFEESTLVGHLLQIVLVFIKNIWVFSAFQFRGNVCLGLGQKSDSGGLWPQIGESPLRLQREGPDSASCYKTWSSLGKRNVSGPLQQWN